MAPFIACTLIGDLTPVPIAAIPFVIYAKASLPVKSLKELIACAAGQSRQAISRNYRGRLP
jgi:hypothetical protein